MTDLINRFSDISRRYDAVFCDLWGCLHNGVKPYAEAVSALQTYRTQGGVVLLLTNSPRPKSSVVAQLDQLGVPHDCYDEIVSSGDASQIGLLQGLAGEKIHHIGPSKDESFFTDITVGPGDTKFVRVPLDQAKGIVCTGLLDDRTETPEDYRPQLLYAKQKNLKLLCTNPDIVVDLGDKRIYCAGAIAALYTEMGGQSIYFGKPHPPIYDLARLRLAAIKPVADANIICIGDGIHTDIQGGLGDGFDTLFITSGLAADQFGEDDNAPDPVKLQAFFNRNQLSPTAAISFLR